MNSVHVHLVNWAGGTVCVLIVHFPHYKICYIPWRISFWLFSQRPFVSSCSVNELCITVIKDKISDKLFVLPCNDWQQQNSIKQPDPVFTKRDTKPLMWLSNSHINIMLYAFLSLFGIQTRSQCLQETISDVKSVLFGEAIKLMDCRLCTYCHRWTTVSPRCINN